MQIDIGALPGIMQGPRISTRAPRRSTLYVAKLLTTSVARWRLTALALVPITIAFQFGCARNDQELELRGSSEPRLVVIAPVANLSGSRDFDPLKITDIVASELLSFPGLAAVPVNLTLASLAQRGKTHVDTAEEALELARELGADMTIVVGVTEFNPYDPPIIGMIMQIYVPPELEKTPRFDAVGASRAAAPVSQAAERVEEGAAPRMQLQRVFNGSMGWVQEEVRAYAKARDGDRSPLGWRKHLRSQELYARYCAWSLIRSMLVQEAIDTATQQPIEAP